jgi:GMP synthase PP-ATPase subunit
VFLPVRSVGVIVDGRRYDYVVSLRAVETIVTVRKSASSRDQIAKEHISRRGRCWSP